MRDVLIIGGGISGLVTAYRLHQHGLDVLVAEASGRPGGAIWSEKTDGYLLELGPNTIQRSSPEVESLISDLGLTDSVLEAPDSARRRYIVKNGRPVVVPSSPREALSNDLFSYRALLKVLTEPFRQKGRNADESIASFVRRRLGPEILDYAVDPFVSGVYAGDPKRISIKHAFPRIHDLEQKHGSVIRGQIMTTRSRKPRGRPQWKMFNFKAGLSTLPGAISKQLGTRLRLNTPIQSIKRNKSGWRLEGPEFQEQSRFLVYAAPLHSLGSIDVEIDFDLPLLAAVSYPPLAVVFTGYKAESIRHPLDGFGMLVPSVEKSYSILGSLFTSTLFPDRAPAGNALLTTFVGGQTRQEVALMSRDDLYAAVHNDLSKLLNITDKPVFSTAYLWQHSIPQYEVGYDAVKRELASLESQNDGLFFAGNYLSGVSVTDTITVAEAVAAKIRKRASDTRR